jgi:hypothetical protein
MTRILQVRERLSREAVDSARFDLIDEMRFVIEQRFLTEAGRLPHVVCHFYRTTVTPEGTETVECSPQDAWEFVDVDGHLTIP